MRSTATHSGPPDSARRRKLGATAASVAPPAALVLPSIAGNGWVGHFILFGLLGWCLEVVFTGVVSLVRHDASATSKTYLWMFPIYGLGGLALTQAAALLSGAPLVVRVLVYVGIIYAIEFSTGWLLERLLGRCPWDYTGQGISIRGLIRLDYAPAWLIVALLFESARASGTLR